MHNTLWFFCFCVLLQTAWYIFPTDFYFVNGTLFTVLTYGLGHLCLREVVNRLEANTMLLVQPITLLLIFISVRVVRSHQRAALFLARLQSHMMLVRVMWFVLIYSYTLLILTSARNLWCVWLDDSLFLAMDGTIECFGRYHFPYALASILIIILLILPPPIILAVPRARGYVHFKGFADEASRIYRHERCWWSAINLGRRIAITVIGSTLTSSEFSRLAALTCFLLLLLMAHEEFRYERKDVNSII